MPNLFRSPNPWIKATAISAAALTVSVGLCGLNAAAFSHFHLGVSGAHVPGREFEENLSNTLVPLGILESVAIAVSTLALLVCLAGLAISTLARRLRQP